jgi:hypothetical protein
LFLLFSFPLLFLSFFASSLCFFMWGRRCMGAFNFIKARSLEFKSNSRRRQGLPRHHFRLCFYCFFGLWHGLFSFAKVRSCWCANSGALRRTQFRRPFALPGRDRRGGHSGRKLPAARLAAW